ncbi:unnamed protein product [Rhizoctonia solani]|uniref:Uncharacterized protein n=2 Tax=Rhizoctonia solani TaxID=456999 RepID=A0A8H2XQY2_9AGAM|nr:unnamed protein product [Rhizoctonia solani]
MSKETSQPAQSSKSSKGRVLTNVEPDMLESVLEFTAYKNDIAAKKSSLKVDERWILDNLEGKDERAEGPVKETRQGNREGETASDSNNSKNDHTKGSTLNTEDPKLLIGQVVGQIREEFKFPGKEQLEPEGLGVGPNLSKLLKEVQGGGADVDGASNSQMRGILDPDGGSRDPENNAGTSGQES